MHPSVTPLASIYRLNTGLLLNCIRGVTDDHAAARITGATNSIGFLVAHLIDTRHYLADLLGAPLPSPFPPAFARAKTMDDAGTLPPLAELTRFWDAISAHLAVEVERLDTPGLARAAARLPGSDGTVLGALAFLAQHESYHLGQIALLRRQLGLPAMSYAMEPREPGRMGA